MRKTHISDDAITINAFLKTIRSFWVSLVYAGIMIVAGILLTVTTAIGQGQKNFLDQPYIEVQGSAEREVNPDIVFLSIYINEADFKNKVSLEEKESQFLAVLSKYAIDPIENLTIDNLSSDFHRYIFRGKQVIKARSYRLRLDSIPIMGNLIVDLEALDISNVGIAGSEYSKREALIREVKMEAMANSRDLATSLAAAIGQEIGAALHIVDLSGPDPRRAVMYMEQAMMSGMDTRGKEQAVSAPLNISPEKVSVTVAVKYLLR